MLTPFKILQFILSLLTCVGLAWVIAKLFKLDQTYIFLALAFGLPLFALMERIKNIPAHIVTAAVLNKKLVADSKVVLRKLPIITAEGWNEFHSFYDTDSEIEKYRIENPKAFAVSLRSEIANLKGLGHLLMAIQSSWVFTQAMDQMWQESCDKEQKAFVKSQGFESWPEYMVKHGSDEHVRKSWEKLAEEEKQKRERTGS